ncbi:NAD(P)/FAD-dependent oxidoreductase [Actinosynnema sp. NPDC020468]|uniref:phytoene desaturase family protein n=1 Tax=Actinosynnema sp. NPDC020468 TaxID=3154488 RepID=UPI003400EAEF
MSRSTRHVWDRRPRAAGSRPRVIVVGAGVAGMSAACYGQMSGLETRIFEMHVLPGGCCTAWSRGGYLLDYCIDWLNGTAPGNEANQVWRELGALDGKTVTTFDMFNRVVAPDGRQVTFHTDPDRLQAELEACSPADADAIRAYCADYRRFTKVELHPFLTPPPLMTLREKLAMARKVVPLLRLFARTAGRQMADFADGLRDEFLGVAFRNMFFQDPRNFAILPYHYTMAAAHNGNVGVPQGGSLGLARSVEERYLGLGGRIDYRAKVTRILVEEGRAVGVELRNGERHYADHVIAACDTPSTVATLLEGRYTNPRLHELLTEVLPDTEQLYPSVVSVFVGYRGDVPADEPHSTTYLLEDHDAARLPGALQKSMVVHLRSRFMSGLAPEGSSLIHCNYFADYDLWKSLRTKDRRAYWALKKDLEAFVREFLERRFPGIGDRIELVQIATPATTERYTGNHRGAILAWKSPRADDLLDALVAKDRLALPGLAGFHLAGHWVGGGSLIKAASSGRFATQFACRELGVPFRAWESTGSAPWHPGKLGELPQLDHAERRAATRPTARTAGS